MFSFLFPETKNPGTAAEFTPATGEGEPNDRDKEENLKFVEEGEEEEEEEEIPEAELKDVHLNFAALPPSEQQFSHGEEGGEEEEEEEEEEELMEDEEHGGVMKGFQDEPQFGDPNSSLGKDLRHIFPFLAVSKNICLPFSHVCEMVNQGLL